MLVVDWFGLCENKIVACFMIDRHVLNFDNVYLLINIFGFNQILFDFNIIQKRLTNISFEFYPSELCFINFHNKI